ncbi:FMN-dependent alpha-hydroxy acid dehydrogenase [Violaceomyces palustris]|uniref:FMN-dependent alpha-hydroxy acid dehydrogenase n=1 Tax=Violaceomyces palustris TaxID=1673888 RepID=A0ACD0P4Z9_9BASI|nr:FMN-dependent alpha-hydroxy acid dehydrogenase [Violaceomyces palustris]
MNRAPTYDKKVHCIADLEREANQILPEMVRDFFSGGSMDLLTLNDNRKAFDRYRLRPRVMVDVSSVDTTTDCLGSRVAFPLGFSPAANHGLAHADAELATSRAAASKGVNMVLSSWSNTPSDLVAEQGRGKGISYAHQLSAVKDQETNLSILRTAEKAGFKAIFLSVDCPWLGRRLNEMRNHFSLPSHLGFPNFPFIQSPGEMVSEDPRTQYASDLVWSNVRDLKRRTKLEIWLKGILTAEDASLAVEAGADGIVVSNHGGRQLDGALSTLDALPEVVRAVQGRIPVHLDGGIRRGSDIFKALALGADHCWVGRVPLWGLAYKGERGVRLALDLLHDEFRTVMALMGCAKVGDIRPEHLARLAPDGTYRKVELDSAKL